MNRVKRIFSFESVLAGLQAVMLTMAVGIAGAQEAPPAPPKPPKPPVQRMAVIARSGSYLGVGVKEIDAERARELKLREEQGVELTKVDEDGPAAKAGLKDGDVVTEYNGQRVEGTEQFVRFVRETPVGRQVKLGIVRGGANQIVIATIGSRRIHVPSGNWEEIGKDMEKMGKHLEGMRGFHVEMPDIPKVAMAWRAGMLGVEVEGLESLTQLAEFLGVKKGVLVRSVVKDLPAAKAGIKAGDVIVKVDEESVSSPREVTSAVRSARKKGTFSITVMRDKREMALNVAMEPEKESTRPAPAGRTISNPQQFEF